VGTRSAYLLVFMIDLLKTIVTSFLCALISTVAQGQVSKKTARAVDSSSTTERGAKLAETGHCDEALPLLKRSFPQTSDKDLKLRIGIDAVRCAMTLNQPDLAVDFLRTLNREFPRSPEVLYLSVHIYSDLSTRASQELANVAPTSYQARQLNAEALEVQGKWDEAEKEYRKILEENPHAPGIHFRLGRNVLSKPETATTAEDAKKEFEAELEIDPRNAGAEYVLGELAREAGRMPEAVEHFTRATKLDAGFGDAFLGLGMALVAEKKYADAIPPLETVVKLQPGNPAGHYNLAIAYGREGRKEDAQKEAALQKATAEKIEQEKQKGADAMQKPSSGQESQKPELPK
jgi:tetratricopeptide (TPR) repeat protein